MKTATILAITALALPVTGVGISYVADVHASHEANTLSLVMVANIEDQLRIYDSRVHDFRMTIRQMKIRLYDLETITPENSKVLRMIRELNIEIEGDQRLLDQFRQKILYEEKQKKSLMRSLILS